MVIMKASVRAVLAVALGIISFEASASAAIQTALMAAPGYSWSDYGVQGGHVIDYRKPDGSAGGQIIPFTFDVFDNDPDPTETSPEKIGNLDFQFLLWRGSGDNDLTNNTVARVGAAIMGGFNLTDRNDVGMNFSFLQIFTDNANPNGVVDGGGFRGKVNGDIAGWNQNPGHNYAGTQFDYFDNPFDPSTRNETVSFETALVCYSGSTVHILADFTWSFTSDGMGGVSGTSITSQASASNRLFNLYGALLPPGGLLQNIGVGSCHDMFLVPEPSTLSMLCLGSTCLFLGYARRVRKQAA